MKRALILCAAVSAMAMAQDARKSGAEFMGEATRAMQRDDSQNPAMLWVGDGEAMWQAKACASCHGDARKSMRGVAARYPAFDSGSKAVLTLGQRINQCRTVRQHAEPMKPESREWLAIESYVALQSRGMPVNPPGRQAPGRGDRARAAPVRAADGAIEPVVRAVP